MLCVVGGKLRRVSLHCCASARVNACRSEGINFKDRLGRCVVMVGVPFPNAHDVVMQQVGHPPNPAALIKSLAFIQHARRGSLRCLHAFRLLMPGAQRLAFHARRSSSNLIENRTMRAVNQSVGRWLML